MSGTSWLACAALAALVSTNPAHAAGGIIDFQGVIAAPTCGLQASSLTPAGWVSECPSSSGLTRAEVNLSEHMGAVTVGPNQATLTLHPVVKGGDVLPGVYIAQLQYI